MRGQAATAILPYGLLQRQVRMVESTREVMQQAARTATESAENADSNLTAKLWRSP